MGTVRPGLDNALFQWQDGERRLQDAGPGEQARLESAVWAVLKEIRRRLGSSFEIAELVDLYAAGTDWAEDEAQRNFAGGDSVTAVDAAFGRYAREAADWAGGRMYFRA